MHELYLQLPNYKTFGDIELWENKGTYFLSKEKQGSKGWKLNRIFKVTGGNVVKAIMLDRNCTREQYLNEMIYNTNLNINLTIDPNQRGIYHEDITRKKYETIYNVKVVEVGSASLKDEPRYSSSTDGIVYFLKNGEWIESDIIIEIKCPKKLPYNIQKFLESKKNGFKPNKWYYKHIFISTYVQMQVQMHILNKKYCDYIIDPEIGEMYIERVPYNKHFINREVLPKLNEFFKLMDERVVEMVEQYQKSEIYSSH